jgi:hypothetical protein
MVRPYAVENRVTTEYVNQSLPGTVFRLTTPSPSFIRWVGDHPVAVRFDNWLALSATEARLVVQLGLVLFALAVVWSCRTPSDERDTWKFAAEASIIVLGMLLFSERTWKHHAVTLMLPVSVIVFQIAAGRRTTQERWLLGAILAMAMLLVLLPGLGTTRSRLDAATDPGFAKVLLAHGAYTWAFVLLLIALVVLLRWEARASRGRRRVPLAERTVATQPEHRRHRRPYPILTQVPQRSA